MRTLMTVVAGLLAAAPAAARRYNTSSKPMAGMVNVHVVPHTHDDVGWLKTVDEYFMGANNSIQHAAVQYIIDSAVSSLERNPDRKFIYVEQAFFQRWWAQADAEDQASVQQLVSSGQLEFINGGWCMHDEASPTYVDMIDQTTLGHRLIKQQFGVAPKATWQIDPFGHSGVQQSLMTAASGFQSLYFGRADYQDRSARDASQNLEFVWQASASQPWLASFTGLIPGYGPPGSLNFDMGNNGATPIQDDPTLEDMNVDYVVGLAVQAAMNMAPNYKVGSDGTLHLMWTMGSDFQYENANEWFKNLDKLIHYANLNGTINMFYSTPSLYTEAKLAQDITWSVKTDDFFPYADHNHSFWTGYFTSRPAVKGYVRDSSSFLQASRQLQTLTGGAPDLGPDNPLYLLERAMGVAQHHDAVSGTEKQHVAYDYARRIARGRTAADASNSAAFATLTGYKTANYVGCDLANATICPALESGVANVVAIYNSQGQTKGYEHVRIPVGIPSGVVSYAVTGPTGQAVTAQMLPLTSADTDLRTTYYGYNANPTAWLAFTAQVPAMGYSVYIITPSASADSAPSTTVSKPIASSSSVSAKKSKKSSNVRGGLVDQTLTNGEITLTISATTGMVSSYTNSRTGITVPLTQQWLWYNSSIGNAEDSQSSGAYIFRPNTSTAFPVSTNSATVQIVTGPVVSEARITVCDWITQVVRLWTNASHVEIEWTVGPVPTDNNWGKEVITRYGTGWNTAATWYTDSNGRDAFKRVRDYRPTWNYSVYEPVAGNFYPVNAFITTQDSSVANGNKLQVVVDRTQSGSSMVDGSVELMVHRRLFHDDGRGVGEPLDEPGLDWTGKGLIIRGVHRLTLDPSTEAPVELKRGVQDMLFRPLINYAPLGALTPAQWIAQNKPTMTGLTAPLPDNLHLLTVHSQGPNTLLLRLAHLYEVNEDPVLSQNVTVALSNLFSGFAITSVTETTLTANQAVSAQSQYTLKLDDGSTMQMPYMPLAATGEALDVTLGPMQIRTFVCTTA